VAISIRVGSALACLRAMPADSVHCCVTSPPYWGLRDYGTPPQVWGGDLGCRHQWGTEVGRLTSHPQQSRNGRGVCGDRTLHPSASRTALSASQGAFCQRCGAWRGSLGLEPTYQLYVDHLVEVLRAVRRVLRPDGTLWLNLGDCYANDSKWGGKTSGKHARALHGSTGVGRARQHTGLKPKDLVGIPWRVAFALQDDGWWLRRDIVWHKPNPMPESVRDRCTSAHEYLFHLTKSARYFFDGEAIKEPAAESVIARAAYKNGGTKLAANRDRNDGDKGQRTSFADWVGGRNKRSVWTIATSPFPEAHFATFPPALVEPCILAGTSERGVCPCCGAPWVRVIRKRSDVRTPYATIGTGQKARASRNDGIGPNKVLREDGRGGDLATTQCETIGWRASCSCNSERGYTDPIPATVLDPFLGAGTTALVAARLGRDCIGIELSPAYAAMAERRTATVIRADVGASAPKDRAPAKLRPAA
jgi:DNA modification methylase